MHQNSLLTVASTTLSDPLPWSNSTLFDGDVTAHVRKLKGAAADIGVLGSGALVQTLAGYDLVDTYVLMIQDRTRWDRALIAEGQQLVRRCLRLGRPGSYQLQAAINAVHADAQRFGETDWRQIVALYDQLVTVDPNPVVALNRAVAVAEVSGAQAGLDLVDALDLGAYYPFQAVRADLLRRLGRNDDAVAAYDRAIARTENDQERAYLTGRRSELA